MTEPKRVYYDTGELHYEVWGDEYGYPLREEPDPYLIEYDRDGDVILQKFATTMPGKRLTMHMKDGQLHRADGPALIHEEWHMQSPDTDR